MHKRTFSYSSILCFLSITSLYAGPCPSKFACITSAISGTIAPDVPIVYTSIWDPPDWGQGDSSKIIIDFGNVPSSPESPPTINYPVTFGTLNVNGISNIYINSISQNSNPLNGYYTLKNVNGNGAQIAYSVTYTACNAAGTGNMQAITPPGTLPAVFTQAVTEMAGKLTQPIPACHPENGSPGNGAGELTFTLQPPANSGSFSSGSYQDTLTVIVCSQQPCT